MDDMGAHVALWLFISAIQFLPARDKLVQDLYWRTRKLRKLKALNVNQKVLASR